eukprot:gnl/MRDRNA2_/MRDRNA2_165784_c0_seq1.p1 gnl/MRDRNA2_/MRDRNA2_165784_c0~~gnl/MRDRNA2_/MRDRNA2_165784_c0_seq1.p1  ORF type:complete len:407 (+),score=81.66 gnl/MRDRNA2_/MRDRNA2_165784_c0_seq1:90-1310(+)
MLLKLVLPLASFAVSPVVIIPGDGSSQLEARLDKPKTVAWYCSKKTDWFRLWLDTSNLLGATSCWADNIKLFYDEEKDELSNNLGVETRVPDFGGTSGLEELDPNIPGHATAAFRKMVMDMVDAGYVRNSTVRGAPYDFRYAPSSPVGAQFIQSLKMLIEETYKSTGARVSLISHSMGCLQTLYFLQQQPQTWKDNFIERWIPLAGVWAGAAKELRLHASGDNEGLPVDPLKVREEQRTYETNFWLAPVPRWFGDQVLVSTPKRNYSAQDYDTFFDDIGFPAGKKLYQRVANLTSAVEAPGVDVVCMYGSGVDTPLLLNYADGNFDNQPKVINGDGDGTVNAVSLKLCQRWTEDGAQSRSAKIMEFPKVTHSGMLTDDAVLKALYKELGMTTKVVGLEQKLPEIQV